MNFDELSDDELTEYEDQLQSLSEKDLLVYQLVELQRIRYTMELMASDRVDTPDETETDTEMYVCNRCSETVAKANREDHAQDMHGWIEAAEPLDSVFSKQ